MGNQKVFPPFNPYALLWRQRLLTCLCQYVKPFGNRIDFKEIRLRFKADEKHRENQKKPKRTPDAFYGECVLEPAQGLFKHTPSIWTPMPAVKMPAVKIDEIVIVW